MSNFNFYGQDTPASSNTGACTFSNGVITTANNIAALGDIVYFKISDTVGAVGVCTEEGNKEFTVDTNIYSSVPASFTPDNAYKFDVDDDLLYSDVSSYRFENSVRISTYSESYRPYRTNLDFKILVNTKIREFNGDLRTMLTTEYVVFKDDCEDLAYLVSFAEDTFVTLNNKFKSSLEFNIATR